MPKDWFNVRLGLLYGRCMHLEPSPFDHAMQLGAWIAVDQLGVLRHGWRFPRSEPAWRSSSV